MVVFTKSATVFTNTVKTSLAPIWVGLIKKFLPHIVSFFSMSAISVLLMHLKIALNSSIRLIDLYTLPVF